MKNNYYNGPNSINRLNMRKMKNMVRKFGKKQEKNIYDSWNIFNNSVNDV